MTDSKKQAMYSYLIAVAGVVLVALVVFYDGVRATIAQANFGRSMRLGGGFGGGQLNVTRPFNPNQFIAARQLAPGSPFGLGNVVMIVGIVIVIVGMAWLGLILRKVPPSSKA